jgi:hypothetical protein
MSLYGSARELASLLEEVADVDWRRPAWWGLVAGTAVLERLARQADGPLYPLYLSVNGGPRADTFMARDRAPATAVDARVARAVARARAAAAALARLDGQFPDQPLRCSLRWRRGWLVREPATLDRATFLTPRGAWVGDLSDPARLRRELAAACVGPPLVPPGEATAVGVSLVDHRIATARHLHRLMWADGRGPWLGLGQAEGLEVVTTCHFVVDGYGHGRIASETFAALDRDDGSAGGPPVAWPAPEVEGAEGLGFAAARVPAPSTSRAGYALGRALLSHFGNGTSFSPTFQIPVAPGAKDDPERRRRRVLFALASVRLDAERPEPYAAFARRLAAIAAREADGRGVLTRILRATTRAPLPAALRRRMLTSNGETSPHVPPIEVLAGRGSLSAIRYPADERPAAPLYAVSSPALSAPAHDPRGAVVLTLIHHGEEATATLCGNGIAGSPAGARAFLDTWRAAVESDPQPER